jgi:hypothetical protein
MTLNEHLLEAEPAIFAKTLALERVYGTVNSYVRVRNDSVAIGHVAGQIKAARVCGASEEEIRGKIRKGMTDPPHGDPNRADEIGRRFLS